MSCVTFVNLASRHSIWFTLKLWANSSPCIKASPLDWKSVESSSFTFCNMTFNFSTIPLCSLMDKFTSFLPSLGFSWYPGMDKSLALFEQPSADLERYLLLFVSCFFITLRTWFSITTQEKGKTPFQTTVTSVRLKSLQMNTMRRGELQGVSKVVLLRKGRRKLIFLLWMDWTTHRKMP